MVFLVWQLYHPFSGNTSLVVQHVTAVLGFMKGHVAQGLLQGFEPLGVLPGSGLISVLISTCLRFRARLLTTRNL